MKNRQMLAVWLSVVVLSLGCVAMWELADELAEVPPPLSSEGPPPGGPPPPPPLYFSATPVIQAALARGAIPPDAAEVFVDASSSHYQYGEYHVALRLPSPIVYYRRLGRWRYTFPVGTEKAFYRPGDGHTVYHRRASSYWLRRADGWDTSIRGTNGFEVIRDGRPRQDLIAAGLLERFDSSKHPNAIYHNLKSSAGSAGKTVETEETADNARRGPRWRRR